MPARSGPTAPPPLPSAREQSTSGGATAPRTGAGSVGGGTLLLVAAWLAGFAAAAAFAVPVAVLTALRVLLHAADRTRPEGETDGPGGPSLREPLAAR